MRYNQKYFDKVLHDPLPPLPEEERIYIKVDFRARDFARSAHCGFDDTRKLWFTGIHNASLEQLISLYGIDEQATSEKAKQLLNRREKNE